MTAHPVTPARLADFVFAEARLLDAQRWDEWHALFADDGVYWVPLSPDATDPRSAVSLAFEDRLLREVRIERLKNRRAPSQQPASRCHHLLQPPFVESTDPVANRFVTRTEFIYHESRAGQTTVLPGTAWHHLGLIDGRLRIHLKRIDLLHAGDALPAIQLFI